jgi:beta-carotene ketolase (CrtO type)
VYDVIVVGGGHNGLTCAAYLAKAGKKVLVLEANPRVGGFVITDEFPGAPGFLMNTFAFEFPFRNIRPSIVDELDLARFGLAFTSPDPHNTHMAPDGASFSLYQDLDRTCESMARLSRHDADYYRSWMRPIMDVAYAAIPYLTDHPTRPGPGTVVRLLARLAKGRKNLLPGVRVLTSSPLQILDGFEREEFKAFFAMNTVTGAFRPLDEPLNTSILIYFAFLHLFPLRRPVGGAGAFSEAIAACVRAEGGEVRTSAPVERILVSGGRATGVRLVGGEEVPGAEVMAAVDPTSLFTRLVGQPDVPPLVRDEVRRMQVLSSGVSHFKADLAVSRRPAFPKHDTSDEQLAGMSFTPSLDYVRRLMAGLGRGELPEEIPFYIAVPSVLDRTLVPPGSDGESIAVWVGAVPYNLGRGEDWGRVKHDYLDRVVDLLEDYSPGLRDSILDRHVASPRDFNEPWAYMGSSRAVDLIPSQSGPWRPSPSIAGYRTPIDGLWHTGHGAHPMSGTNGWPGRTAARTLLKHNRNRRLSRG